MNAEFKMLSKNSYFVVFYWTSVWLLLAFFKVICHENPLHNLEFEPFTYVTSKSIFIMDRLINFIKFPTSHTTYLFSCLSQPIFLTQPCSPISSRIKLPSLSFTVKILLQTPINALRFFKR